MDMHSPMQLNVVFGRFESSVPLARLLSVPIWSTAVSKLFAVFLATLYMSQQIRRPAHAGPKCTNVHAVVHKQYTLTVCCSCLAVTTALTSRQLLWYRLSILYFLPLLHILELAKGWSWAFDPEVYRFHLGFIAIVTAAVFAAIYSHAASFWDTWCIGQQPVCEDPLMSVDWNAVIASNARSSEAASGMMSCDSMSVLHRLHPFTHPPVGSDCLYCYDWYGRKYSPMVSKSSIYVEICKQQTCTFSRLLSHMLASPAFCSSQIKTTS